MQITRLEITSQRNICNNIETRVVNNTCSVNYM